MEALPDRLQGRYRVLHPTAGPARPVLFESPHSGRIYPGDFESCQPRSVLARAEDAFVDELIDWAPALGITTLLCDFPRAYVDVNREADDIAPELLAEPWPGPLRPGPKSGMGIGLIRRVVTPDEPIYDRRLTVAEVRGRIERCYHPYVGVRDALADGLGAGGLLVQWHSMKAVGNSATPDGPVRRPDVVLGNRHGETCPDAWMFHVKQAFEVEGFTVACNDPYAGSAVLGGLAGRHAVRALQIELNRALYMDERAVAKTEGFARLRAALRTVTEAALLVN